MTDDVESFDLASNIDGNEFLASEGMAYRESSRPGMLWNTLKYWIFRNRMYWQTLGQNATRDGSNSTRNARGIPMYDLDDNSERVGNNDELSIYNRTKVFPRSYGSWMIRRGFVFKLLGGLVLATLTVVLMQDSFKTNMDHRAVASALKALVNSHDFDPYLKYNNGTTDFYPLTIMVSLDGFHPSLISKKFTPFLHQMYTLDLPGVNITSSPYMKPSFPTQTFPNHWTLVTGEYPIDHGMVANLFWDHGLEDEFSPKNLDPLMWLNASEPIWQTVQAAFSKSHATENEFSFKVAAHMWPGSSVNYTGINGVPKERMPYYVSEFDPKEKLDKKLDKIMSFIDMPSIKKRPQMILSYVPQVDEFGHLHGYPISTRDGVVQLETNEGKKFGELLNELDNFIAGIFAGIKERNIEKFTNVVIVSDHGMSDIQIPENAIPWEDLLDSKTRKSHVSHAYFEGPMLALYMEKTEDINKVYQELKANLHEQLLSPYFNIYINGQFPEGWNFNSDSTKLGKRRVAPIWIVPEPGFAIMHKADIKGKETIIGSHGYGNNYIDMRAMFIGAGPYFNPGYIDSFDNVEIYKLLCDITGVSQKDRHSSVRELKLKADHDLIDDNKPFEFVDLFAPQEYQELLLEDDFDYLGERFGSWSSYNYIWGGFPEWQEEDNSEQQYQDQVQDQNQEEIQDQNQDQKQQQNSVPEGKTLGKATSSSSAIPRPPL